MLSKTKYTSWLKELRQNIYEQKLKTVLQVNTNLILLNWYLGKQILEKIEGENWGAKIIEQLSIDLQKSFPDEKGFSRRNLLYMKQFAEAYPNFLITQPVVALIENKTKSISKSVTKNNVKISKKAITQPVVALIENSSKKNTSELVQPSVALIGKQNYILQNPLIASVSWSHHILILDKCNTDEERNWYINIAAKQAWSKTILKYNLDTDTFNRRHKKSLSNNFSLTMPKAQSDLANDIFKDPYKFGFLQLGKNFTEREFENTLIKHIREFIIELGAGFSYVGQQQKIKVGKKDKYIDLLFYHLHLRCFVVIELKTTEFEFEHTGQMIGYLNAVDVQMKREYDNPSIGIILCSEKDDVEVDYALRNIPHSIGISEYEFMKILPKKYQEALPTAKMLKDEVKKFFKNNKNKKANI